MPAKKTALTATERRFLAVVGMIVFLLLNSWLVWPHFDDWKKLRTSLNSAKEELQKRKETIKQLPELEAKVKEYEKTNPGAEDQTIELLRLIQTKASSARINITSYSPARSITNEFFIEQLQTITIQGREAQIIEFLYQLGQAGSLIRVRGLSLRPDPTKQFLVGNITVAASIPRAPTDRTRMTQPSIARTTPGSSATSIPNTPPPQVNPVQPPTNQLTQTLQSSNRFSSNILIKTNLPKPKES